MYQNYHNHKHGSQIIIADSHVTIKDYAKRCKELGHKVITSVEHGWQGLYHETYEVAKENDLKWIFGSEAYFVYDRKAKDKTNNHIILLAKNYDGFKEINRILSQANIDGYYYRPRIDLELLFSLNPENVFVTTACIAFFGYGNDTDDIILKLHNHFQENFMLEVQYHHFAKQYEVNNHILDLSRKNSIDVIAGLDSHYIYPEQKKERQIILEARGIRYDNEDSFTMDYPDEETVIKRFKEQKILSNSDIERALNNTNKILDFDDITFDTSLKLPTIYPDLTQEEKDNKYKQLINSAWNEIKTSIPEDQHDKYKSEIVKEVNEVIKSGMSDYFLDDHYLVELAKKKGGKITLTARGSGCSFFTNTLLGFSKLDRISAPVQMFPERFMTATRILETKQPPDLDLNTGNPEVFIESQEETFGKENTYPMIAFDTFQDKSAFKIYAKVNNIPYDTSNEIAKQIDKYETALKYASDDEKDLIDIDDYIDEQYRDILEASHIYKNIISGKRVHACGHLIYLGNINEEVGLIRVSNKTSKKDFITTVVDGETLSRYGFFKNDILKVDVVNLIYKIYDKIGITPPTAKELWEMCENDTKVWNIYANGWTLGINQCESYATTKKVMKYKPTNIAELCAFVAAIRPAFKSMYPKFENREYFEYGIKSFDKLIQTDQIKSSFIIYQEQIMRVLNYAGFSMDGTYEIIKYISKKKKDKIKKIKPKFIKGFTEQIVKDENIDYDEAKKYSNKVWEIVEDNSSYSFNSSHAFSYACDSLYCAYLKAYHPFEFYETLLQEYSEKGNKDKVSALKKEMEDGFKIHVSNIKFRQDNRKFKADKDHNSINQSLVSIKYLNQKISNELYKLKDKKYNNFVELLLDINNKTSINSRQLDILIKLNYFSEFGKSKSLNKKIEIFNNFYERSQINKDKLSELGLSVALIEKFSQKETDKLYKDIDINGLISDLCDHVPDEDYTIKEKIIFENDYLGYIKTLFPRIRTTCYFVSDIEVKYTNPIVSLHCLCNGESKKYKVKKRDFNQNPFKVNDIINGELVEDARWKMDKKYITDKNPKGWYQDYTDKEILLKNWTKVKE